MRAFAPNRLSLATIGQVRQAASRRLSWEPARIETSLGAAFSFVIGVASSQDALNNRHPPSLRAFKPLAARPKAVAGSNPALCFSEHSGLPRRFAPRNDSLFRASFMGAGVD